MWAAIASNRQMSPFRKIYKLAVLVNLGFGKGLRSGSQYTVLAWIAAPQAPALKKLFRSVGQLQRKEYRVKVDLMIVKKGLTKRDSEMLLVLAHIVNLRMTLL